MFFWLCQKCGCNVFSNVAPCIIPVFIGISGILGATYNTFVKTNIGTTEVPSASFKINGVLFHGSRDTHLFLRMLYTGQSSDLSRKL